MRSFNCDMSWPLLNMYWESSGFGLGGYVFGGGGELYLGEGVNPHWEANLGILGVGKYLQAVLFELGLLKYGMVWYSIVSYRIV